MQYPNYKSLWKKWCSIIPIHSRSSVPEYGLVGTSSRLQKAWVAQPLQFYPLQHTQPLTWANSTLAASLRIPQSWNLWHPGVSIIIWDSPSHSHTTAFLKPPCRESNPTQPMLDLGVSPSQCLSITWPHLFLEFHGTCLHDLKSVCILHIYKTSATSLDNVAKDSANSRYTLASSTTSLVASVFFGGWSWGNIPLASSSQAGSPFGALSIQVLSFQTDVCSQVRVFNR